MGIGPGFPTLSADFPMPDSDVDDLHNVHFFMTLGAKMAEKSLIFQVVLEKNAYC